MNVVSKVNRYLMIISSRLLQKPAHEVLMTGRFIRYKLDALLFPKKMALCCPCCGMRLRSFVSSYFKDRSDRFDTSRYEKTRQDVVCPFCGALPRHRILALWCEKHQDELKNADILYFAPEKSMTLWMKRNGVACTTADLTKASDMKIDIQDTELPGEAYDVVIANHVLEHVDDYKKALKEIHRILKSGGFFICSFPMDKNIDLIEEESKPLSVQERIDRFGQDDHRRVFGMNADQLLIQAGYDVETIDGDTYPADIMPIVGPADYDMNRLFICWKGLSE